MSLEKAVAQAVEASALVASKPFQIRLIGPAVHVFNALAVHVLQGYIVNTDAPLQMFPNGNCELYLCLGSPNEFAIQQAKENTELAVAQEEAQYRRDVEAAAKQLVEAEKRAELEKQKKAIEAEHAKKLAQLEKDTQAILAKLNQ